ncbi:MAG: hypothetical protein A2W22_00425 [Candidatus Levybacteria bacterium RBG_16_35_11]|nr:MAG: hypothetical protein A2W22_00425 [Candidatus Levybacteria bacterium RBG_16_35_11]
MRINVPLVKQEEQCGGAAMSMIYKFFGINLSEEEIIKRVGKMRWGTFTTEHALMADKLGFNVACYSYNLDLFSTSDLRLPRHELIKKTKELISKRKRSREILKTTLRALESNIQFEMKIPSLQIIKDFLNRKLPVGLAVTSAVLKKKKKNTRWGHFIVITGYENDKFYYNDPKYGKEFEISADKLIFAISCNVIGSSAYLLVISRTFH